MSTQKNIKGSTLRLICWSNSASHGGRDALYSANVGYVDGSGDCGGTGRIVGAISPWHVRRTRKAGQAQTHRQTQTRQTDTNRTDKRNQKKQTQTEVRQDDNIRLRQTSKDTDKMTTEQQRSQFAVVEDELTKQGRG
jgi:hypothetical protein